MATLLKPAGDVSIGGWTNQSGGSQLFESINEDAADDLDYIRSSNNPISDISRVTLSNPPGVVVEPFVVNYRIWSAGVIPPDLTARLWQGATLIAEWEHTSIPASATTHQQTLTTEQFNSITNFSDLEIEFEAGPVGYTPSLDFSDARNSMYVPLV